MRIHLSLIALLMCAFAHGQTPGAIVDAATLPNPLDPNSDGWITTTGSAFTGPVDETEFELPFVPIPEYQPEPVPDNQVPSTSCTMYELVGDATNGVESTYYYYQDPDGISDNGDERIFFRFRVARVMNSSAGFSILIDTDQKFGFAPNAGADPNAVVGNPGFELEVSFTYTGGQDILVYNVDGVTSPTVVNASYPTGTHLQVAYALNQDPDCSARVPGFIDIYLPFSALGFSSAAQIRMVGASAELTGSVLGGKASDISGVDGNVIAADDDQYLAAIGGFPAFSFQYGNNSPPSATDATVSLNENPANGTAVHTVSATDPDGDALTYAITGGNINSAFAIDGGTGAIAVTNSSVLDFEVTPSFALTVNVSDGILSDDAVIAINLNDINEIPSATDATVSLNENPANGTAVHTVSATDPDGDALTYAITGGNINSAFAIDGGTGAIVVTNSSVLDFEVVPSFALTVNVSDGTLSDNAVITINQNDVNEIPSATDATASLNENATNGTVVHTVSASDPDGDALTYTITAGNTGTAFAIDNAGQITVNNVAALDFEVTPSFALTVNVSDGTLSDDAVIAINLNDINEIPSATDATASLNENATNGTVVHTVSASDPDGDVLTYTITAGNTGTAFAINNAGQITVSNATALDYQTVPSYTLTITVSDGDLYDEVVITVNLVEVNKAPSAVDATVSLSENSANGTVVHTIDAIDPDGDPLTYAITAGNRDNTFGINQEGTITVVNSAQTNFETTPVFVLTVDVTDGQQSAEAQVTINLLDINEAPSLQNAVITIAQNLPSGSVIHKFVAEDPDANDTFIFSIASGNSGSVFIINETTGEIIVNDTDQLDLFGEPAFELTIMVRDAGGLSAAANLTIHLEKVDDGDSINPLKGFSPNGDGINDFWLIKGIESFPDNEVKVFNRWGNLVFETKNYNNDNIAWRGFSNNKGPDTTYFFLITVEGLKPITGYVVVKE